MNIKFIYRYELVDTLIIHNSKGTLMIDIILDNMDEGRYYVRQLNGIDLRHNDFEVLTSSYDLQFCREFIKKLIND